MPTSRFLIEAARNLPYSPRMSLETNKGTFFLVVPPGLEDLALIELRGFSGFSEIAPNTLKGGIELELPLSTGFALLQVLRVPTRILLRVADYGCRDFPKLFKRTEVLPWNQWLGPSEGVDVRVATSNSRLRMKNRIAETIEKAIQRKLGRKFIKEGPQVLVRIQDDVVYLSLNISKDNLYQRGYRSLISKAPLRENLAASLLLDLFKSDQPLEVGRLIDPMMGSGTFLEEVLLYGRNLKVENCFLGLRSSIGEIKPISSNYRFPVDQLVGIEMLEETFTAANENINGLLKDQNLSFDIDLKHSKWEDFITEQNYTEPLKPSYIIANPPWGERLEGGVAEDFAIQLAEKFSPVRLGILVPQRMKLRSPVGYKLRSRSFQSGGIAVQFYVFEKNAK